MQFVSKEMEEQEKCHAPHCYSWQDVYNVIHDILRNCNKQDYCIIPTRKKDKYRIFKVFGEAGVCFHRYFIFGPTIANRR